MRMRLPAAVLAAGTVAAVIGTAPPTASATPAAAPQYKLVLGPANSGEYVGINSRGDIVGIGVQPGTGGREEGFIIKAGTKTPLYLGTPGDETNQHSENRPRAINDQGVVVGNYQKVIIIPGGEAEIPRPTIWPGPDATGSDIGVNPAGDADAFGINGTQQIVGSEAGHVVTPWLKTGSTVTNLPVFPGGTTAEAAAVNASGTVVGDGIQGSGLEMAARWVNGAITPLGQLGGSGSSEAVAVNASGVAVGSAGPSRISFHAVMFSNGRAIDLNAPGGDQSSTHATAINSAGVIVGDDGIDPDLLSLGNGFVYRNGHATELNDLVAPHPNVRLAGASGINDAGDIVGTANVTHSDGTQDSVGYELVPLTTG